MAGIASIAWLRKGGICIVDCIGVSSIWSWSITFTLHWGLGELGQLGGATRASFELLMIYINNLSLATNWTMRTFCLAEKRISHVDQHQICT